MANSLAIRLNLLKWEDAMRIKNLLEKYELPTRYTVENVNRFYNKFFLDKKSIDGKLKFILPNGSIGSHIIKKDVDEKIVKDVIMEFAK
jgi:3-dehydroquinate synthase